VYEEDLRGATTHHSPSHIAVYSLNCGEEHGTAQTIPRNPPIGGDEAERVPSALPVVQSYLVIHLSA